MSLRHPTGEIVRELRARNGALILKVREVDNFDGLDLRNVDLAGISITACCCQSANLSGADLRNADLYWAIGHDANFTDADLSGATFCGANFSGAIFVGANLIGADFGRDNLNGTTTLKGADLRSTTLQFAKLEGATFNTHTRFPEAFNPRSYGMIAAIE